MADLRRRGPPSSKVNISVDDAITTLLMGPTRPNRPRLTAARKTDPAADGTLLDEHCRRRQIAGKR